MIRYFSGIVTDELSHQLLPLSSFVGPSPNCLAIDIPPYAGSRQCVQQRERERLRAAIIYRLCVSGLLECVIESERESFHQSITSSHISKSHWLVSHPDHLTFRPRQNEKFRECLGGEYIRTGKWERRGIYYVRLALLLYPLSPPFFLCAFFLPNFFILILFAYETLSHLSVLY